jgi:hypothetical protein
MNKIITIGREFGSGGIISEIAKRTSLSEQYVKSITDMESKIKRCREKATEQEHLSDKELRQHIMEIDKRRAKYYSFFRIENGKINQIKIYVSTQLTSI